jgi:transcriptional regulator with PAS, ATPase and Fis domain/tetratricopeptide (TPR) repeat protein
MRPRCIRKDQVVDPLQEAFSLKESGLFTDALRAFEQLKTEVRKKLPIQMVRGELLERVGRTREARHLIQQTLAIKTLGASDRSLGEFVLARVDIDTGDIEGALSHLNRSISLAQKAGDFERVCSAQLKLLLVLSDGVGASATGTLLAEVRANAARTGNPRILAAVHVYFAQIEALRGSVESARRHIRLAVQLLKDAPNFWLESVVENINVALSIMASELEAAEIHSRKAAQLAARTGGATEYAVNEANSGIVLQLLGRLDQAVECYERTIRLLVPGSQNHSGAIESLARVRLTQRRFDDCEALLSQIEQAPRALRTRATYVYRHALVTRAQLSIRKGDSTKAARALDEAARLAEEADDHLLKVSSLLARVDLLLLRSELSDIARLLPQIDSCLLEQSADVYAQYERALSRATQASGNLAAFEDHLERAKRIYASLHHIQGLTELQGPLVPVEPNTTDVRAQSSVASAILHSAVALLSNAKHPEFVARELVSILVSTDATERVVATVREQDKEEILVEKSNSSSEDSISRERRLTIAETAGKLIELVIHPRDDVESIAVINSVANLVLQAHELTLARHDRSERATIWPANELASSSNDGAAISGHMREVMLFAQRVARTSVNVLITGESGTGKEIIARAIHDFSDRAQKPFVPFNCAAIPRDLLESQLFGHRRGAFTGADRDQLGLIRSAADGTIFLDEVGELSLDLQPKLLRFLESGEIAPLGDPSPSTVKVRVIAATNTNLEDAVRDRRFREDLFYRLNVVRLSIKPLRERRDEIPGMITHFVAEAARESKKGYLEVAEETLERLLLYRWPGNVRQLQNEIRRIVAMAEPNSTLEPESISLEILAALPRYGAAGGSGVINGREIAVPLRDKLMPTLSRIEYEMIKAALREHHGRLEPAAKSLGISRKGLYLKRQRLGL